MKEKIEGRDYLFSLFELYGPLLSKTQKEIMEDYLSFDLSFSEISSNRSISRSAVEDALKKGEKKLHDYEEKLSFKKKSDALEAALAKAKESGDYKELEDLIHAI